VRDGTRRLGGCRDHKTMRPETDEEKICGSLSALTASRFQRVPLRIATNPE